MDYVLPVLTLAIGAAVGIGAALLILKTRIAGARAEALDEYEDRLRAETVLRAAAEEKARRTAQLESVVQFKDEQIADLSKENVKLQAERKAVEEKLEFLNEAREKLADTFTALAARSLEKSNTSFLDLAKQTLQTFQESAKGDLEKRQQAITATVKPVNESLVKFEQQMRQMDKDWKGDHKGLGEQINQLMNLQNMSRDETTSLVNALKAPQVRGQWGEMQLKRVVEMAGMLGHCDFLEQQSVSTEDGALRPDMIVKLPGGKNIVVDAKAPLAAYMEALEAADEKIRAARMKDHARQVRDHVVKLSARAYWKQFQPTPDFVVLFLPGETFFSAALEHDPSLIQAGVEQHVLIASPTTLITLLKAVAYGWREESLTKNAEKIRDLGKQLHDRISACAGHWADVGKSLNKSVESYNKAVRSLESRLLVSARKFQDLDAASSDAQMPSPEQIEITSIEVQAPEFQALSNEEDKPDGGA
jgi:DNA recombination protein RmuC